MKFALRQHRGETLVWILAGFLGAAWASAALAWRGIALRDDVPRAALCLPLLLAAAAAGLALGRVWGRRTAVAALSALAVYGAWNLLADGWSWGRFALLVLGPLAAWRIGRLTLPPLPHRDEAEEERPFLSLVLLLRRPLKLDRRRMAQLATQAWDMKFKASAGHQDDTWDDAQSCLVEGDWPRFYCQHPQAVIMIHHSPRPDCSGLARPSLTGTDPRIGEVVSAYRAWLSVDVALWLDEGDGEDVTRPYRLLARLLACLADDNCLALFDPAAGRILPYDTATASNLRSDNPLLALRASDLFDDDPRLQDAVEHARARWCEFVAAFERRDPGDEDWFAVRVSRGGMSRSESLWLNVGGIENGVVYGKPNAAAAGRSRIRPGQPVRVRIEDVMDWLFLEKGRLFGGFTIKLLGDRRAD